jgi:hypothetical protein
MQLNLQRIKALLIAVIAVSALVAASPALQRLLVYPQTEFFSEIWLLGPEHVAEDFPFNITSGTDYHVFLGVGNHLGSCAYYVIQVKFRNMTQPGADSFNHTASSLLSLYSVAVFVADNGSWELPVTFSLAYTYDKNPENASISKVSMSTLTFNGHVLSLQGCSAAWDAERDEFFGNLFFELWIYNDTAGIFQYHQRYTSLNLNMTV